jgi:hypothetical protein
MPNLHRRPTREPTPKGRTRPRASTPRRHPRRTRTLGQAPRLHPARQVNCGDPCRAYDDSAMCALLALQQECLAWLP